MLPRTPALRRIVSALSLVAASAIAGCSGGGFLPFFGEGPHFISDGQLNQIVQTQSREYKVPAKLIRAVIAQESGEDPSAISTAGAMGLMQLMPGTAREFGVANPFDPAENVEGGTAYLAYLLRLYHGDKRLALAAYNAGSGAVAKYGGVPPYAETRDYVRSVLSIYQTPQGQR